MGTRNITIVKHKEKVKVAQYCQWDGYPSGQGATVYSFLKTANLKKFKAAVSSCTFLSKEDVQKIWKDAGADESGFVSMNIADKVKESHPQLSRDTGADILEKIYYGDVKKLSSAEGFEEDSVWCEWAYHINLDDETLKVYSGDLVAEFKFDELPDTLEEFCKICTKHYEEDED